MNRWDIVRPILPAVFFLTIGGLPACGIPDPPQEEAEIPSDYTEKHMPQDWWNDEEIIEEGRLLYVGKKKSIVNCSRCHGKTGQPVKSGARDFRNQDTMKKYSDSYLLWRVSEGVPFTQMRSYKSKLSEQEMWKIIAYLSTFGMSGYGYDAAKGEWVPHESG